MNYYKNFLRTVKAYLARQLGLKSGALVLDCGTGRGLFASALVDLARVSVMSVDSSMDSIKEAILELKGKVELIRADLRFLPF
jgi:ubiquinone/menaquinone biosynthesis C-methylase UbiE